MHCPGAIEITTMCQCDIPKLARRNRKILSNIIPTFTGTSCIGSVKFNISNSNFSPVLSLTIAYHLLPSSSIFRTIFLCCQNRLVITEIANFPSPIVDKTSFQTDLRSSGTICRPLQTRARIHVCNVQNGLPVHRIPAAINDQFNHILQKQDAVHNSIKNHLLRTR